MTTVRCISCGLGEDLPDHILRIIKDAHYVVGSSFLLNCYSVSPEKQVPVSKDITLDLKKVIKEAQAGKLVVVLGSGDALFHGIGATLKRVLSEDSIKIDFIPGPTAFQHFCAKLGLAWDILRHFSVHSSDKLPLREIVSSPMAVVYGGNTFSASVIAKELITFFPECAERAALIAEDLNRPTERIERGALRELATLSVSPTSMLLLLPRESVPALPIPLGLSNDDYSHDKGLITAEEVRVVALSKLQLPCSGVLWDLGAGSGSVGIEAAGLVPNLSVHAVEKKPNRVEMIRRNIGKIGVTNVSVYEGDALEELIQLPQPDRVFIGGGGTTVVEILSAAYTRLRSGGLIVVAAVTLETICSVQTWDTDALRTSLTIDIAKEEPLGKSSYTMYKSNNRITLFIFRKPNEQE